MASPHLLDILEAVYDLDASAEDWQQSIVDQARRVFPGALGALGFRYTLSSGAPVVTSSVSGDSALLEVPARGHQSLDLRHIHRAYTAPSHAEPTLVFHTDPVTRVAPEVLRTMWTGLAVSDMFGVYATRPHGESMTLGIAMPRLPSRRGKTYDYRGQSRSWSYVAQHIESALSVRDALGNGGLLADFSGSGGGLFSSRALLERDELRQSAAQLLSVENRCYRGDACGLSVWRPLLEGQWSLVRCRRPGGGTRFLAIENPRLDLLRRLSSLEQSVAEMAALGHSNKWIAATLSLHESSIANILTRSLRKLGIERRDHLVILARVLRGPGGGARAS